MKSKWTLLGSILAVLLLALAAGLAWAQGPQPPGEGMQPQGEVGIQVLMGTAFTYQGQLKKDGSPVNGTCDFQFSLWNSPFYDPWQPGGGQVGSTQTKTDVEVTNGLFTITNLDFGAGAFQGDARWLQIAVRCPAGSGDYTELSSRQKLNPAPYALALPGLWTKQNDTSPNVIGGYSRNSVTDGVYGATIGGGGASGYTNGVTDIYGTVGGGRKNQAGNDDADLTNAPDATVSGGQSNTASGQGATVGGGRSNTASGQDATIGGGRGNTASGTGAFVGGGGYDGNTTDSNEATGKAATICGGLGNTASGGHATIGGGVYNQVTGSWDATVGGGYGNIASGQGSTVPGGIEASAVSYGQMAYASGKFASAGDAQTSVYVLRRLSSGTTLTELFLDGSGQRLTIASGRTVTFDILVVGREDTNGESAGYRVWGVIENVGGTTAIVGSVSKTVLGEDDTSWDVTVDANDTNDALRIQVQGGSGDTVRWVAMVRTVEVSW